MGYVRHNAIVATAWEAGAIEALTKFASELGADVVAGKEVVNGYRTALIAPDGSKEGWANSDEGDSRREKIRAWLRSGKFYWEWAEFSYGDDPAVAEVVDSKWEGRDE